MAADVPRYQAGAWVLASELPLDLPRAPGTAQVDWTIRLARRRRAEAPPPFHRWVTPDGQRWLAFSRLGADYLLRVSRLAWFRVDPGRHAITWERPRTADSDAVRHLVLNQVVPLALSTDHLALHASVVATPAGALVMAGHAGAGKSTLAAALVRQGHPLVSDDSAVLEPHARGWAVVSGVTRLRLWPDVVDAVYGRGTPSCCVAPYTRKRRVDAEANAPARRTPMAAVCLLDPRPLAVGAPPSVRRLSPREALVALLPYALRLDVTDRGRSVEILDALADLVGEVPVLVVRLDRRLSALPRQAAALLRRLTAVMPATASIPSSDEPCVTLAAGEQ